MLSISLKLQVISVRGKLIKDINYFPKKLCGERYTSFSVDLINMINLSFTFFSPPGPAGPSILMLSLNMIRANPLPGQR